MTNFTTEQMFEHDKKLSLIIGQEVIKYLQENFKEMQFQDIMHIVSSIHINSWFNTLLYISKNDEGCTYVVKRFIKDIERAFDGLFKSNGKFIENVSDKTH